MLGTLGRVMVPYDGRLTQPESVHQKPSVRKRCRVSTPSRRRGNCRLRLATQNHRTRLDEVGAFSAYVVP